MSKTGENDGKIEVIEWINKHYGQIAGKATEIHRQDIPRIRTGIFGLDYALGGGIPVGRITVLYGYKSSGKSTIAARVAGEAQRLCAKCYLPECNCNFRKMQVVWVDLEGTYEPSWGAAQGINNEELLIVKPETAEATVDVIDKLIRSKRCDLIILDSIAAMVPIKEIEESAEAWQQGLGARILNKGVRRWVSGINKVFVETNIAPTLLFINQIRMKIGVMYGDPATLPGGLGIQFATSVEVKLWAGKYEVPKEEVKPVSVVINYKVEKNKTAVPRIEGAFKLYLRDWNNYSAGQVSEEAYLIRICRNIGLIEHSKGKYIVLKEHVFNTLDQIKDRIITDRAFREELERAALMVLLNR